MRRGTEWAVSPERQGQKPSIRPTRRQFLSVEDGDLSEIVFYNCSSITGRLSSFRVTHRRPPTMHPKQGDVFLYPGTGPDDNGYLPQKSHKCVIIKVDDKSIYAIPISSLKGYNDDRTCVLAASTPELGLSNTSYMAYWASKITPKHNSIARYISTLPAPLLLRIVDGITKSRDTPEWFRNAIFPPEPRRILNPESRP